jgi:hypothetical protein
VNQTIIHLVQNIVRHRGQYYVTVTVKELKLRRKSKSETRARQERGWREVARIVGAGLFDLPEFFRNGLYRLTRSGLPKDQILLAYQRCESWHARAKKNGGIGECECSCQTRQSMDAKNAQGQSIWCLDHDPHRKVFRGVLYQKCNVEVGDGDRARKFAHASYALAHEARIPEETALVRDRNEFQAPGAVD